MTKKIIIWVIIVVVAVAVLVVVFIKTDIGQRAGVMPEPSPVALVKNVPAGDKPLGFPTTIPIEKGATIIQNYEADTADGQHQATRVFESKLTVAQNYKIYSDFLAQNSWTIKKKFQTENLASLSASKKGYDLTVNISRNTISGTVRVSLNVVTIK